MNKLLSIFIISLIYINLLNVNAISTKFSKNVNLPTVDTTPVQLIVNPNNKNNYDVGVCGNSTLTCNNMADAIESFKVVANIVTWDFNVQCYQKLILLLDDGTYNIDDNLLSLYQYNITIQPLNEGSNNGVVFDGSLSTTAEANTPLLSISPPIIGNDTVGQNSYVTISGILFKNFAQPLLVVSNTIKSFTAVIIQNCQLYGYKNLNEGMISFNKGDNQTVQNHNSILITNIDVQSVNIDGTSTALFDFTNTIAEIYKSSVSNGNAPSLINTKYSIKIGIKNCQFENIISVNGLVNSIDSPTFFEYNTFNQVQSKSSTGNGSGSVLTYYDSTSLMNDFEFSYCNFIACNSTNNGYIIYAVNSYPTVNKIFSYLVYSNFSSSWSNENGGIIYSNNIPIIINNCSFVSNGLVDGIGSLFYLNGTSFEISGSSFSKNQLPQLKDDNPTNDNSIIFVSSSNFTCNDCKFEDLSISCSQSYVNINTVTDVGLNIVNSSCKTCQYIVNNNQICSNGNPMPTTTTTTTTTSSTTSSNTGGSTSTTGGSNPTSTTTTSGSSTTDKDDSSGSFANYLKPSLVLLILSAMSFIILFI